MRSFQYDERFPQDCSDDDDDDDDDDVDPHAVSIGANMIMNS